MLDATSAKCHHLGRTGGAAVGLRDDAGKRRLSPARALAWLADRIPGWTVDRKQLRAARLSLGDLGRAISAPAPKHREVARLLRLVSKALTEYLEDTSDARVYTQILVDACIEVLHAQPYATDLLVPTRHPDGTQGTRRATSDEVLRCCLEWFAFANRSLSSSRTRRGRKPDLRTALLIGWARTQVPGRRLGYGRLAYVCIAADIDDHGWNADRYMLKSMIERVRSVVATHPIATCTNSPVENGTNTR
jgi:hypothetical protein